MSTKRRQRETTGGYESTPGQEEITCTQREEP